MFERKPHDGDDMGYGIGCTLLIGAGAMLTVFFLVAYALYKLFFE